MNTRQVARSKEVKNVTLFATQSIAFDEILENWVSISIFHPQTMMIRAITSQQWKQLADNPLTKRELCLLQLIAYGKSNLAIAQELSITVATVKAHVRNIFRKLNVRDRTQATIVALRSGLVN